MKRRRAGSRSESDAHGRPTGCDHGHMLTEDFRETATWAPAGGQDELSPALVGAAQSPEARAQEELPGQAAAPGPAEEGSSGPTPASREGQVQQLQRQNPFRRGFFSSSWADPLSSPVALAPTCRGCAGASV